MTTFADLLEQLKRMDELILLEALDLTSRELVDLLEGYIFDHQETIREFCDEDDSSVDW